LNLEWSDYFTEREIDQGKIWLEKGQKIMNEDEKNFVSDSEPELDLLVFPTTTKIEEEEKKEDLLKNQTVNGKKWNGFDILSLQQEIKRSLSGFSYMSILKEEVDFSQAYEL
jgi:hypothetical protein